MTLIIECEGASSSSLLNQAYVQLFLNIYILLRNATDGHS